MIAVVLRGSRGLGLRAPGLLGPELALAALADWRFWRPGLGLSRPLFCAALAAAAPGLRPGRGAGARRGRAAVLLVAALAPSAYRFTALSAAFAVAGTLLALRRGTRDGVEGWPRRVLAAAGDVARGPRQAALDLARRRRLLAGRRGTGAGRRSPWLVWVAPGLLAALFTALLASANPLIAAAIADLPLPSLDDLVAGPPRLLFWAFVLAAVWPLVRPRRRRPRAARPVASRRRAALELEHLAVSLLSPAAVLRALLLLDLLLAAQIGLDGAYLWGGVALPHGMSYAAYAHRGAYPLVATALVAGALALAVGRPGAAPSGPAAALLLLFLGENVVLVVSAMERLALYVAAYSLTEWRVAAFAWMGLVAFGLGSIAAAQALGRGWRFVLRVDALAALAVLYGWTFVDVPRLVADYDVAHCAELKGEGPALDIDAVGALGPGALPALDRFLVGFRPRAVRLQVRAYRGSLESEVRAGMADWRSWSFARWRLARYLDTVEAAAAAGRLRDPDDP